MSHKSSGSSNALIVFLIQPFVGFLMSLKHFGSKLGGFIFIAFATLWGYAQSFTYTPTDGYRVAARFCQFPVRSFSEIINDLAEGNAIDIYLSVINYFVHWFSNNPKVYFAVLGFVFGLFCYWTLSALAKEQTFKDKFLSHLLFLLFVTNSFSWLTAPRFFTASWIAVLVFLKISWGKSRWVWLAIVLPLVHFSFFPISLILFVVAFSKKLLPFFSSFMYITVLIVFVLSFILPETVIAGLIPQEALDESTKLASKYTYVSGVHSDRLFQENSAYREANVFITNFFHLAMKVGSFLILTLLFLRRNKLKKNQLVWTTYNMTLPVAAVVYYMSIIPSSGWRYINVFWLILYIVLFRYYYVFKPQKFYRLTVCLYAINIYTISFMFYVAYRTVDFVLFYAPLPFVIMSGIGFPPVYYV